MFPHPLEYSHSIISLLLISIFKGTLKGPLKGNRRILPSYQAHGSWDLQRFVAAGENVALDAALGVKGKGLSADFARIFQKSLSKESALIHNKNPYMLKEDSLNHIGILIMVWGRFLN